MLEEKDLKEVSLSFFVRDFMYSNTMLLLLVYFLLVISVDSNLQYNTTTLLWKGGEVLSKGGAVDEVFNSALHEAHAGINRKYDMEFPSPNLNPSIKHIKLMPGMAGKRCSIQSPRAVYAALRNVKFSYVLEDTLVSTIVQAACLGDDSFGNMLSHYFETMVCANIIGAHFFTVAKVFNRPTVDVPSALIKSLPDIVINTEPANSMAAVKRMEEKCVCTNSCHEKPSSVWHSSAGLSLIRSVIKSAVQDMLISTSPSTSSGDSHNWHIPEGTLSTVEALTTLPLIPTVAIHYRCGDNFQGEYGFVKFAAITSRVRDFLKSQPLQEEKNMLIYILAEKRNRKTSANRAHVCDMILTALFDHVVAHFPSAKAVVLKRGGDMYVDFAMLSLASVTICSVSTFCLWPALSNPNTVYFPQTKLILEGKTPQTLGFSWMPASVVTLGGSYGHTNGVKILTKLKEM